MTKRELAMLSVRLLSLYTLVQAFALTEIYFIHGYFGLDNADSLALPGSNVYVILLLPAVAAFLWFKADWLADHIFPSTEPVAAQTTFGSSDFAVVSLFILGVWFVADGAAHLMEMALRLWWVAALRKPPNNQVILYALSNVPPVLRLAAGIWFILKPHAVLQWFKSHQTTEHNQ